METEKEQGHKLELKGLNLSTDYKHLWALIEKGHRVPAYLLYKRFDNGTTIIWDIVDVKFVYPEDIGTGRYTIGTRGIGYEGERGYEGFLTVCKIYSLHFIVPNESEHFVGSDNLDGMWLSPVITERSVQLEKLKLIFPDFPFGAPRWQYMNHFLNIKENPPVLSSEETERKIDSCRHFDLETGCTLDKCECEKESQPIPTEQIQSESNHKDKMRKMARDWYYGKYSLKDFDQYYEETFGGDK